MTPKVTPTENEVRCGICDATIPVTPTTFVEGDGGGNPTAIGNLDGVTTYGIHCASLTFYEYRGGPVIHAHREEVIIHEGRETTDHRLVPVGVTTWPADPLPLYLRVDGHSRDGSLIGQVTNVHRTGDDVVGTVVLDRPIDDLPPTALAADCEPEPVTSLKVPFVFKRCHLIGAHLVTADQFPWKEDQ